MKKAPLFLFAAIIITLQSCKQKESNEYLGVPVSEIETQLTSLLNNFYPRITDTVNGGYWTNFENDWSLSENQDKMLVTQARGLWTASRAAELFPDNPVFRKAADHGFIFLTQQMWDTVNGGFYQNFYIDSVQKTDASFKLAYGNSFALYALSQYAMISKDPGAVKWVKKEFDWFENKLHDPVYKGYYNIWVPAADELSVAKGVKRAGWGDFYGKDQNTSIHLMEALTAAYRVLPDSAVKERLAEILELVRDSMTTPEGYLNLFFDKKWQPISNHDSTREYIIRNPGLDHISFGHNIETAYLLIDAAAALYGNPDSITLSVASKLTEHTLNYGFDKDYYGLFDKGYHFDKEEYVEVIDSTKVWWAQAEAWHTLALMSELYPDNKVYPAAFRKMWSYITQNIVDPEFGGWYNSGIDGNPLTIRERKAHAWKSCYHDGRAMMNVLEYARKK